MATAIETAREQAYQALSSLPTLGLRKDHRLILKRYEKDEPDDTLSMDPNLKPSSQPVSQIEIKAPKVEIYSGFGFLAVQTLGNGVIEVGDHVVTFPRASFIESFLNQRLVYPTRNDDELYPEMQSVVFELNGQDYRPVRWLPKEIMLKVYIRRVS